MYCFKCGTKVPDGARFCHACGNDLSILYQEKDETSAPATRFVPAKCTNCGGKLDVDPEKETASCPFCGTTFIVDKAIKNYQVSVNTEMNIDSATVNIHGATAANYVLRAKAFEEDLEYPRAIEYYEKALDIDYNNEEAQLGTVKAQAMIRAQELMDWGEYELALDIYKTVLEADPECLHAKDQISLAERILASSPYIEDTVKGIFSDSHILALRDRLVWQKSESKHLEYMYTRMKDIDKTFSTLEFVVTDQNGKEETINITCSSGKKAKAFVKFIQNAQNGILPKLKESRNF